MFCTFSEPTAVYWDDRSIYNLEFSIIFKKANTHNEHYLEQLQNTRPIHLHLTVRFIERGK